MKAETEKSLCGETEIMRRFERCVPGSNPGGGNEEKAEG
jgi:hypothetical protein